MLTMPSPQETDLLFAAFLPRPAALLAWRRLRDSIDWNQHIDPMVFALLPSVYRNLRTLDADDPLFPRFKGIARQAWLSNQRRIGKLSDIVGECQRAQIDFLLLPPLSRWLEDSSAILVRRNFWQWAVGPDQAARAIRCFLRTGWRIVGTRLPSSQIPGYVMGTRHVRFKSPEGEEAMLTWGLEWWFGQRVPEVWNRSSFFLLGKHRVRGLNQTDAVEFILRKPPIEPLLNYMTDILAFTENITPSDWQRLNEDLKRFPLPPEQTKILARLKPYLVARCAEIDLGGWCGENQPETPHPYTPESRTSRLRQDWSNYRKAWSSDYSLIMAIQQVPGYLMARWQLNHPWQLVKGLGGWLLWNNYNAARKKTATSSNEQ